MRGLEIDPDSRGTPETPIPSVSVDEAIALHPKEWIIMKVTALDKDQLVSHGEIIFANSNLKQVGTKLTELMSLAPHQDNHDYYVFAGYPRIRTGAELRKAIKKL